MNTKPIDRIIGGEIAPDIPDVVMAASHEPAAAAARPATLTAAAELRGQ